MEFEEGKVYADEEGTKFRRVNGAWVLVEEPSFMGGLLSSIQSEGSRIAAAIPAGIAALGEDITSGEPGWQNVSRVSDALTGRTDEGANARSAAQTMGVQAVAEPVAGFGGAIQGLLGGTPDVGGIKQSMVDAYGGDPEATAQFMGDVGKNVAPVVAGAKATDAFLGANVPGYDTVSGTIGMMPGVYNEYADAAGAVSPVAGAAMKTAPTAAALLSPFAGRGVGMRTARALATVNPTRTPGQLTAQQMAAGIPAKATATKRMPGLPGRDFEGRPQPNWRNQEMVVAPSGARGAKGAEVPRFGGTDKAGAEAVKQGFDADVVAAIKSADPVTRRKMQQMLKIVDRVRDNAVTKIRIRPSDVIGDALHNRVRIVRAANKSAGRQLKPQIEKLRGVDVDINPAVSRFVQSMDEIGIKIVPTPDGPSRVKVVIAPDSDVAGLPGIQSQVEAIVDSMSKRGQSRAPEIFKTTGSMAWDAKDVHHFKKYIDNLVDWGIGKDKTGVAGNIERIAKNMRHDLNTILGEASPGYKAVNDKFSETVQVWDALQDILGQKIPLDSPQSARGLGRLMKRITSNAQSRERLQAAVDDIEKVARKYQPDTSRALVPHGVTTGPGINISDDLDRMIVMVDNIEKRFGSNAANSLQGNLDSALERQARNLTAASRSPTEAGVRTLAERFDKARGINDENALKALKGLLRDPNLPQRPGKILRLGAP